MNFNDTAPMLSTSERPLTWLSRLAPDVTLEAGVLKCAVQGRDTVVALLRESVELYEFQHFSYRGEMGHGLYMESYRARVQGVPIQNAVWIHSNAEGEVDSILINHYPLEAALLFSRLVWERVGDRYGDLFLRGPEHDALRKAMNY